MAKKFNIIEKRTYHYNRYIPIGAVIGTYKCVYTYKGRKHTRIVNYMVDDFKPYRCHVVDPDDPQLKYVNYKINVYDVQKDRWYRTHTDQPSLRPLANFLTKMFYEVGFDENHKVEYYTTNKQRDNFGPRERKVQNEYIYKPANRPVNTEDCDFDGLPHVDAIPHWDIGNERKDYNHYAHSHKYSKPSNEPNQWTNYRKGMEHSSNPSRNNCEPFQSEPPTKVKAVDLIYTTVYVEDKED